MIQCFFLLISEINNQRFICLYQFNQYKLFTIIYNLNIMLYLSISVKMKVVDI